MSNTIKSATGKDLRVTKIYWGGDEEGASKSVQITMTENYGGQSLAILTGLFNMARQDFPEQNLELDQAKAVALGGNYRKGMWGIEFEVTGEIPAEYKRSSPEYILAGGL